MTLRYRQYAAVLLRRAAIVLTAVVIVGALLRCTHVVDRSFIYFPSRDIEVTPGDVGLDFEDVRFKASDGVVLHGWFIPGGGDATLVWFHGNGGNIGHRVGNIRELVARLQINIFIFDYRGYGRSEGSPYEEGTYLDAEAAIEHVHSRDDVDPEKIIYFGRSLGCAVAAEMAIKHPPRALICESGFTSVKGMTKRGVPVPARPPTPRDHQVRYAGEDRPSGGPGHGPARRQRRDRAVLDERGAVRRREGTRSASTRSRARGTTTRTMSAAHPTLRHCANSSKR